MQAREYLGAIGPSPVVKRNRALYSILSAAISDTQRNVDKYVSEKGGIPGLRELSVIWVADQSVLGVRTQGSI